jgi:nucleoside-diphosphate-sugar epimerase
VKPLVIVGGAGFLGRSFAAKVPAGLDVVSFDRAPAPPGMRCPHIVGDARDFADIAPVIRDAEAVWIRAGILGGSGSTDVAKAETYLQHNTELVRSVLDACEGGSCKTVFFDSTEQIFGASGDEVPLAPSTEPIAGNFYGASKAISEKLLQRWSLMGADRSVQVFRYPRVRSAETRDVIFAMVSSAIEGAPFCFTIDPAHRISFVHVDDVIAANLAALKLRPRYAVYHVACGRPTSLFELSQLVAACVGCKLDLVFRQPVAALPFEPFVVGMSWEESARTLGVYPRWNVASMIEETKGIIRVSAARRP